MGFQQDLERARESAPFPSMRDELTAIMRRLEHPMAEILAKVPGDTLAARARAIGVSRQTMYVWAHERFRPSPEQAATISELTGVPVAHIRADDQEGKHDGAGKPARKTRPRVAKASRVLSGGAARLRAKRAGVGLKQRKRGYVGTLRKRTPKRPSGGKGD
jgi:DNA-binding XRE family transcriptional regulator